MKFGIVGLGRIGLGLARQAVEKRLWVVGYNRSPDPTRALVKDGLGPSLSLDELARNLEPPRVVLVYVPHGLLRHGFGDHPLHKEPA